MTRPSETATLPAAREEDWGVAIPIDTVDLERAVHPAAFVMLRANLEEWWAMEMSEPDTATLGRRLE